MRVHVSDPQLLPDLAGYLRAAECAVEHTDGSVLEVAIPRAPTVAQALRELRLYLATWRAMHEHAQAELLD